MNFFAELREKFFRFLTKTNAGAQLVFLLKKILWKLPVADSRFPTSISLEISSYCNLSCIHCPSHMPNSKVNGKSHGVMNLVVFNKAMDEIDAHGIMKLALHKDGEPLLHPEILTILARVKKNVPHFVTLITNGQLLTDEIADALLMNRINSVIFSIGAASHAFYKKVRGNGFDHVRENILKFLKKREKFQTAPEVTVQILNLPEFPEMDEEIRQFRKYWRDKPVKVMVYNKLNWGIFNSEAERMHRYPCPSLWRTMFVHWNARVSPCCIDWDHSLDIGDYSVQTIAEIWGGDKIREIRQAHVNMNFSGLMLCRRCNYWSTISRLDLKKIQD